MGRDGPAHLALCTRVGPFTLSGRIVPLFNHLVSCRVRDSPFATKFYRTKKNV